MTPDDKVKFRATERYTTERYIYGWVDPRGVMGTLRPRVTWRDILRNSARRVRDRWYFQYRWYFKYGWYWRIKAWWVNVKKAL